MTERARFDAVFWDFGGVFTTSPFEAFHRYETEHGLPSGFLRTVNATTPDDNAWARIERRELSLEEFDLAFAEESARLGHRVPGADVLGLLHGMVRPAMVGALDRVLAAGYVTACLTNNIAAANSAANSAAADEFADRPAVVRPAVVGEQFDPTRRAPELSAIMDRFHHVVESSVVGCRKPEERFYRLACAAADVEPSRVVYLDDLGINLKPARAMGMATIKVTDPDRAIEELAAVLELPLR